MSNPMPTSPTLSELSADLVDWVLEYVGHPKPIPDHMDADIRLRDDLAAAVAQRDRWTRASGPNPSLTGA